MSLKKLVTQGIIWRGFYLFSLLLVNIFLARYLQAAGTGNLYFIILIFSFMQVALSFGVDSGIIYFASGNIIERNKLISLIGSWSIAAGIVMIILTYICFLLDHSIGDSLLLPYCIYSFLYVCGQSLSNYSTAVFYTKENYFLPNFLLAIVNLAFVFMIPGKNAPKISGEIQWIIYLYFFTYFAGGLLVYISFILHNRKESAFGFPQKNQLSDFLRYSVTAVAANLIFFMVYRIDYVFVNNSPVCTAADLGNYIQVSKLGQMLLVVPQIIASVVFPRTASGVDRSKLNKAIIVMARLLSQLFIILFIIIALIGNWVFIKLFGESFNKMQVPMLVVLPGIFSLSVLSLLAAYFSGKGNLKVNVHGAILGLIVMVTGDFLLVPRYGIIAAAAISTLSYTVNLAYSFLQFYKDYSISWVEFIKWKKEDYTWIRSFLKRNVI